MQLGETNQERRRFLEQTWKTLKPGVPTDKRFDRLAGFGTFYLDPSEIPHTAETELTNKSGLQRITTSVLGSSKVEFADTPFPKEGFQVKELVTRGGPVWVAFFTLDSLVAAGFNYARPRISHPAAHPSPLPELLSAEVFAKILSHPRNSDKTRASLVLHQGTIHPAVINAIDIRYMMFQKSVVIKTGEMTQVGFDLMEIPQNTFAVINNEPTTRVDNTDRFSSAKVVILNANK